MSSALYTAYVYMIVGWALLISEVAILLLWLYLPFGLKDDAWFNRFFCRSAITVFCLGMVSFLIAMTIVMNYVMDHFVR